MTEENYEIVNKKIKEDLNNWSTPLLSFSARIDIKRMSILDYLFTCLCYYQLKF